MFFDGCSPDLGCSLVLRGGNRNTLNKLRKIIQYLIYVAYQLKLEAKFLADEFALPPSVELLSSSNQEASEAIVQLEESSNSSLSGDTETARFEEVLKKMILSSSPFCQYPLPYLLTKEGQQCPSRDFIAEKIYWSRYLDGSVNDPLHLPGDDCEWVEKNVNEKVIMKDPHSFTDPSALLDCLQTDGSLGTLLNDFRARGGRIDLRMFQDYDQREKQNVFGNWNPLDEESDNELDNIDGKNKDEEANHPNSDFLFKKQPLEQNKETKVQFFFFVCHHVNVSYC